MAERVPIESVRVIEGDAFEVRDPDGIPFVRWYYFAEVTAPDGRIFTYDPGFQQAGDARAFVARIASAPDGIDPALWVERTEPVYGSQEWIDSGMEARQLADERAGLL